MQSTWAGRFPFSLLYIWMSAWISFKLVEQPFLQLRDLLMRRKPAPVTGPELTRKKEEIAAV